MAALENIRHYCSSFALCLGPGRGTVGHRCLAAALCDFSQCYEHLDISRREGNLK